MAKKFMEAETLEKFKKDRVFGPNGELTEEEIRKLGMNPDSYQSLDECAYQCAYDLSNDWAREIPTWEDVQEAYKMGVKDGIEYGKEGLH